MRVAVGVVVGDLSGGRSARGHDGFNWHRKAAENPFIAGNRRIVDKSSPICGWERPWDLDPRGAKRRTFEVSEDSARQPY